MNLLLYLSIKKGNKPNYLETSVAILS